MPAAVTVEAVEAAVVADSEAALSAVAAEVDTVEAVAAAAATEAMAVEMVALEEAVEVDSVVETAEAAGAEAVVAAEAVTTVIKMVTSHVNAPNKGKSATRSTPPPGYNPDLQRGWYPLLVPLF